jgi:hypothetical protein
MNPPANKASLLLTIKMLKESNKTTAILKNKVSITGDQKKSNNSSIE